MRRDYSIIAFVVLVIILLVVMQQCDQEVTIFESPIMRPVAYFPIIFNNYDANHWREDFNNLLGWTDWEGCHLINNEPQCYRPENRHIDNGVLVIEAYQDGEYYSSALETDRWFRYGTFEIRARVSSGGCLWPALWLLGKTWPDNGEIDVMEYYGNAPGTVYHAAHWGPPHQYTIDAYAFTPNQWHTFKVEWTHDYIKWYVDDQLHKTFTAVSLDDEMRLIVNMALLNDYLPSGLPATFEVDWIEWDVD